MQRDFLKLVKSYPETTEIEWLNKHFERSNQDTVLERFEIYGFAYWDRLIEALSEDFKRTAQVLGQNAFVEMAKSYLLNNPSTSYTLADLSWNFPEFLNQVKSSADIVDLARFELSLLKSFYSHPNKVFSLQEFLTNEETEQLNMRFKFNDSFLLFQCPSDLSPFLDCEQKQNFLNKDGGSLWSCYIYRIADQVFWRVLSDPDEAMVLQRLAEGKPLSVSLEIIQNKPEIEAQSKLSHWFSNWMQHEIFSSTEV